jgi:hypothetical protein
VQPAELQYVWLLLNFYLAEWAPCRQGRGQYIQNHLVIIGMKGLKLKIFDDCDPHAGDEIAFWHVLSAGTLFVPVSRHHYLYTKKYML